MEFCDYLLQPLSKKLYFSSDIFLIVLGERV